MTTALLLSLLATLPAQNDDDPEPPPRKGIVVRLVAKKTTYKLDLGGKTKNDYVAAVKKGDVEAPKVELELVITNYTKEAIRLRTTGSTNRLTLKLEGEGAIEASITTGVVRPKIQYAVLNPKEKVVIPIARLASIGPATKKGADAPEKRHFWTEPGEYKLSASLYAYVMTDPNGVNPVVQYKTFETRPVTLKVEK